ncbi:LacI family transcriptional regulator [Streptomyces sp. NBC_00249]|uniref:LacI family DNA-binding transcriptional regulator n=1 Tax=Streptomyces sp. NBC_00249 TaxID=2975690 RepID=UPI00224D821A|nr:LacI family DNA-binding transcriptional regulator [Streptomyces sp. NBC_00249]MCX5198341.1 LacI family transcriptional regulator [Streptomyces sp. NBC_00249]
MNGHGQGPGHGRGHGRGGVRPTLEEVAIRAGVGRGTASRVVNGSPRVSERAREAVEAAVAELGYVPHQAARALAGDRAGAIALVVPEPGGRLFFEPAFSEVVRGAGAALAEADVQLVLTLAGDDRERGRLAGQLSGRRVDGVLLVSARVGDPLPELVAGLGVPVVIGGRRSVEEPLPSVDFDDLGGAAAAVRHLLGRGRRAIAAMTGPPEVYGARRRLEGYRRALDTAGRRVGEPRISVGDCTEAGGRRAMRELLARGPRPDAVFAGCDLMAVGARRELRAAGLRVPGDVALVGFGDSPLARHLDPPLTSVRRPGVELGRTMARLLLERIQGERIPGEHGGGGGPREAAVLLPTELIVRESS